jgi:hypothetical protein
MTPAKLNSSARLASHLGYRLTELRGRRAKCVIIRGWIDGTRSAGGTAICHRGDYCSRNNFGRSALWIVHAENFSRDFNLAMRNFIIALRIIGRRAEFPSHFCRVS